MMNPIWPDAQPYDNLLFVLIAIILVVINRKHYFNRDAAVTQVLLEDPII